MDIIVPTDFSLCAQNAFKYACSLAKPLEAKLHIYHAANLPGDWAQRSEAERESDAESNKILEDVHQRMETMQSEALALGIKSDLHSSGLPFVSNLTQVIESNEIDLVVLGSHGKNERKEHPAWGSQTLKVVREIDRKVLVVRTAQKSPKFTTVMFATSLDHKERAVFKELLTFLNQFDVDRIHIVAIDTHDYFSQPSIIMTNALQEFKELAGQYDCETHFFRSGSIDRGIRKFSKEYKVDLIALTNSHKSRIWRFIQGGGKLESLVSSTELPVLSIPS